MCEIVLLVDGGDIFDRVGKKLFKQLKFIKFLNLLIKKVMFEYI